MHRPVAAADTLAGRVVDASLRPRNGTAALIDVRAQPRPYPAVEDAKLARLLKGKKLECQTRDAQRDAFTIWVARDRRGGLQTQLASRTLGYGDTYVAQLSVGENIVIAWGDDGRAMAIVNSLLGDWGASVSYDRIMRARGCKSMVPADLLDYPESSPDEEMKTSIRKADCCIR